MLSDKGLIWGWGWGWGVGMGGRGGRLGEKSAVNHNTYKAKYSDS